MSRVRPRRSSDQLRTHSTIAGMPVAPNPRKPMGLTVLPPDEALKRALPMPSDEDMQIEGLTDDEWKAFETALAER